MGCEPKHPIHDVQVVDVLFNDVVAGQPGEVIPVAELPLRVAPTGLAGDHPDLAAVPVAFPVDDVSDGAVLQAFDGLPIARHVAPLRAGRDSQSFLLGQFASLDHHLHARRVHGGWLLQERVFAGLDSRLEVDGPEMRRRGQDHVVDFRQSQELPVRLEAGKTCLLGDIDAQLRELPLAYCQAIWEDIRQGDHPNPLLLDPGALRHALCVVARCRIDHLGRRPSGVQDRAGPAAPATDQSNLDLEVIGRIGSADQTENWPRRRRL